MNLFDIAVWVSLLAYFLYKLVRSVRIIPPRVAAIVERLGKYHKTLLSGFHVVIPFIDKITFIQDLKEEAIPVPPQDCFTHDNVRVEVDGIIYMMVTDPVLASYGVTDYRQASIQLAQTTIRSVMGTLDLDRTFEEREMINHKVVGVLAEVGQTWGIQVLRYEIKNIVPPVSVKNAMERQMTAERERRALIARSEGEMQANINNSEGLKAEMINKSEGEKQRRINEAEGRAREIEALAEATAHAIETVAEAVRAPGGSQAMALRLTESYLNKLTGVARSDATVILPTDLTRLDEQLAALGLRTNKAE
ncbi:MAG: paraslipin [Turneriella sp.]|nr:paraslipin [Leptospiraceae bacterium]MCX7632732.1 paraslipin [Turneriella sp.]